MKVTGTFEVNEIEAQAWLNTIDALRIQIEGLKVEIKQLQLANTDLEAYLEKLEKRVFVNEEAIELFRDQAKEKQ